MGGRKRQDQKSAAILQSLGAVAQGFAAPPGELRIPGFVPPPPPLQPPGGLPGLPFKRPEISFTPNFLASLINLARSARVGLVVLGRVADGRKPVTKKSHPGGEHRGGAPHPLSPYIEPGGCCSSSRPFAQSTEIFWTAKTAQKRYLGIFWEWRFRHCGIPTPPRKTARGGRGDEGEVQTPKFFLWGARLCAWPSASCPLGSFLL